MLNPVQSKDRPKFHTNKVSLSYCYCNVQYNVGYSRHLNALVLVARGLPAIEELSQLWVTLPVRQLMALLILAITVDDKKN
jgi:hypothetical protein